jgi:hypothetical protein
VDRKRPTARHDSHPRSSEPHHDPTRFPSYSIPSIPSPRHFPTRPVVGSSFAFSIAARAWLDRFLIVLWCPCLPHFGYLSVSPTSSKSVPSPQNEHGMPIAPRYPAAAGGCQRPWTAPSYVSPTPTRGLTAMRPRQTFEGYRWQVVGALAWKSHRSFTTRTAVHLALALDSLRLIAHSKRCVNAKIMLAYFLRLHPSQVIWHLPLAHATAAQLLLHESRFPLPLPFPEYKPRFILRQWRKFTT